MYMYLTELRDQSNSSVVSKIIRPFIEGDLINDDIARANVALLQRLDDIGETAVKEKIVRAFRNNPAYKRYLN